MKKIIYLFALGVLLYSCKESTQYQVIVYNNTSGLIEVEAFSSMDLKINKFQLNPYQQIEVYFSESEGIETDEFECKSNIDSIHVSRDGIVKFVKTNDKFRWSSDFDGTNKRKKHECLFSIEESDF